MINITFRQLAAFAKVARLGSFARAAEVLGLSQPALSQTIAQLERSLDLKLFERTTRSVRMTPEGVFLLPRAEALIADTEDVVKALGDRRRQRHSRLSIGSLPSFATCLLPDILGCYRRLHPAVQVTVVDGTSESLYAGVEEGRIDLAIGSRLRDHLAVGFYPLMKERFFLVLRRDHPLAALDVVTWPQALRHDFVAFLRGSGGQAAIDDELRRAGLQLHPVMTLAQSSTVLGMVEAGVGVTALPVLGCPPADHLVLTSRPLVDPIVDREVGVLRAVSRPRTVGMNTLEALVRKHVSACGRTGITLP